MALHGEMSVTYPRQHGFCLKTASGTSGENSGWQEFARSGAICARGSCESPKPGRLAQDSQLGIQMPCARLARAADLTSLLELFRVSEVSSSAEPMERVESIWSEMLSHGGIAVFVSAADAQVVATCMLITAPNLLRTGRRHGFLENVATHPEFRGVGHGRAVVDAALAAAWARDCHHVLLQSGRKDPRVHRFYRRCGFEPGVRTSYVARRPS
jgi:GNAT superfamily N-acetyltransferase